MKNSKIISAITFFSFLFVNLTIANPDFSNSLSGTFTIQQRSSDRYIDAYDYEGSDYNVVTRTNQSNNTQKWILKRVSNNTYTIQQKSTGRFLDAYDYKGTDYSVVTRKHQENNTQKWVVTKVGTNIYTVQQKSTGRYLDAHENKDNDYSLVTRPSQHNNTQVWEIKRALPERQPLSKYNTIVRASIFGPNAKSTKVFGHTFNFEKKTGINVNSRTGHKTVYINFSHHRTARFDDQYHFKATFNRSNRLLNWEYKINRGGFLPKTTSTIGPGRFTKTASGLSRAEIDRYASIAKSKLGKSCSWEDAAKEMATIIARAAASYKE